MKQSDFKPYLILLDIDGTLIRSNGTIPTFNINIIDKLIKMGNVVCLATGRAETGAEYIYKSLHLNTPSILNSGALINNFSDKLFKPKIIPITNKIKKQMLEKKFRDLISCFYVYIDGLHYLSTHSNCILSNSNIDMGKKYWIQEPEDLMRVENITTIIVEIKKNCEQKFINLSKSIDIIFHKWQIFHSHTEGVVYDIQMKSASKGKGGEYLRKMFNILPKNTIAFGDSDNDISSIKWAKNGIAMKNAIEDVKMIADNITKYTNDEAGVGRHLANFFNIT